ncbi:MAG: ABC transporter substrate-binding protein [Sphingomonadales bacterium]|nr:ABC transporter substrate-binding protein [Sphingomonadales bacterium]
MTQRAAVAVRRQDRNEGLRLGLAAGGLIVALGLWAGSAGIVRAQEAPAPAVPGGETITASALSLLGTPKYAPDFPHLDYVNPDAPKGGEIAEWTVGAFDNYNPYSLEGRAAALSSVPHETMMEGTADTIGELYCLLCESLEYPASKDWVIFTLREGITFSDGTPMTAEDVAFSYDQLATKGLSSFREVIAQMIAGVEVLDARRVKYTFQPEAPRRDILAAAGGLPVFSRAQFERDGIDLSKASTVPLIGSGPYVFDSAKNGRTVIWRRNPDYWGRDLPINRGRANFDTIRIEYFGDYNAAFEGFKAGVYTFRSEPSAQLWATAYDFPALSKGQVVKQVLPDDTKVLAQVFAINLRREKFRDVRVREALDLMLNFEWMNKTLFFGLNERVTSFWQKTDMMAEGLPTPEELAVLEPLRADLPDSVFTEPAVLPPVSGERQLDRGNMRKAAALLDAAGWVTGDDGMRRNAKGETLRVELLNDNQALDNRYNAYVENLRAVGIDAVHTRVDDAEYENRRRRHDFDLLTTHFRTDDIPGAELQQYFGSATTGDVFNASGLANPAVDKLIAQIERADTREELVPRVKALDRVLRAERFAIFQWQRPSYLVGFWDQYEHPETLPPYALGEMDFWWYNAEKGEKLKAAGAF